MTARNGTWPRVEFSENDKEIQVTAEVPGLEEQDIEVVLVDGILTLRGEKKSETEDKDRQFSERYYGRFEPRIGLGRAVDENKVAAAFKNGLLTITLPKTEKAQAKAKRIAIGSGNSPRSLSAGCIHRGALRCPVKQPAQAIPARISCMNSTALRSKTGRRERRRPERKYQPGPSGLARKETQRLPQTFC